MLACLNHLSRDGRVADFAAIDPWGSAAGHLGYLDR
jgi:hypothetical protein